MILLKSLQQARSMLPQTIGDGVLHWLPGFSATVTAIGVFRRSCRGFFAKVGFFG